MSEQKFNNRALRGALELYTQGHSNEYVKIYVQTRLLFKALRDKKVIRRLGIPEADLDMVVEDVSEKFFEKLDAGKVDLDNNVESLLKTMFHNKCLDRLKSAEHRDFTARTVSVDNDSTPQFAARIDSGRTALEKKQFWDCADEVYNDFNDLERRVYHVIHDEGVKQDDVKGIIDALAGHGVQASQADIEEAILNTARKAKVIRPNNPALERITFQATKARLESFKWLWGQTEPITDEHVRRVMGEKLFPHRLNDKMELKYRDKSGAKVKRPEYRGFIVLVKSAGGKNSRQVVSNYVWDNDKKPISHPYSWEPDTAPGSCTGAWPHVVEPLQLPSGETTSRGVVYSTIPSGYKGMVFELKPSEKAAKSAAARKAKGSKRKEFRPFAFEVRDMRDEQHLRECAPELVKHVEYAYKQGFGQQDPELLARIEAEEDEAYRQLWAEELKSQGDKGLSNE